MNANIEICKTQLHELANRLSELDGNELSAEIINTCTSLVGMSETISPANEMTASELNNVLMNYTALYTVLNGFMDKASARIPLDDLQQKLMDSKQNYDNRVAELNKAKQEYEDTEKSVNDKKAEIDEIYASKGNLFSIYEGLVKRHQELTVLAKDYSEEKLRKLESECSKLDEETTALKDRVNTVNKHTAECLENISKCLGNMSEMLTTSKEKAAETVKTADEFRVMIETITSTHEKYHGWFNTQKTPLEQFEEDIGKPEADKLKGVLNEKTLTSAKATFKQIADGLEELTPLINACAKASQLDYSCTEKKAGK